MTDDIRKDLQKTFEQTGKRRAISVSMNDAEHTHYFELQHQNRMDLINVEKQYREEYSIRVAEETRRLMRKDGAKTREHKPTFHRDDRFNGQKLLLQARRNVHRQHQEHIEAVKQAGHERIDQFFDRVEKRNAERGHAKSDFNRATDRRSGQGRRQSDRVQAQSQSRSRDR